MREVCKTFGSKISQGNGLKDHFSKNIKKLNCRSVTEIGLLSNQTAQSNNFTDTTLYLVYVPESTNICAYLEKHFLPLPQNSVREERRVKCFSSFLCSLSVKPEVHFSFSRIMVGSQNSFIQVRSRSLNIFCK